MVATHLTHADRAAVGTVSTVCADIFAVGLNCCISAAVDSERRCHVHAGIAECARRVLIRVNAVRRACLKIEFQDCVRILTPSSKTFLAFSKNAFMQTLEVIVN